MKKLIVIFSLLFTVIVAFGQSTPTEVAPDGYLTDASYQYVFGTTADTLTDADTTSYVWRVRGSNVYDINIKLYSDFVSGSAGGTLIAYHSMDGVNYGATGDTITVSSLTADAMDSEVIDLNDFLYPYLKVILIQSGTAVTVPKVYLYSKKN